MTHVTLKTRDWWHKPCMIKKTLEKMLWRLPWISHR